MKKTELVAWINGLSPTKKVKLDNIDQVLYFSLVWNAFEAAFFYDGARVFDWSLTELAKQYSSLLEEHEIETCFDYFQRRYMKENNQTNSKFQKLQLSGLVRDDIIATLSGKNSSKEQKVKAILIIVYKFRNNLFHGKKKNYSLNLYVDAFRHINYFLAHLITRLSKKRKSVNKSIKKASKNDLIKSKDTMRSSSN